MNSHEHHDLADIIESTSEYLSDDGFSNLVLRKVRRARVVRRTILLIALVLAFISTALVLRSYDIRLAQLLFTEFKLTILPQLLIFWGILLSCFVILRIEGAFEK